MSMATLSSFFFVFLFIFKIVNSLEPCPDSCSPSGQEIRFPFGLAGGRCSYPRFNLSCTTQGQPILTLPSSGKFLVQFIDYSSQEIYIVDPGRCLAAYFIKNFSLSGSPFVPEPEHSFTFLNCSSLSFSSMPPQKISCLSNENFTVLAIPNSNNDQGSYPPSCTVMAERVEIPVSFHRFGESGTSLRWKEPDCRSCEQLGGTCGFKDDSSLGINCYDLPSDKSGLPRSAKYGIIVGIGIPGLLCIIGLGCYLCGKVRAYRHSRRLRRRLNTSFPYHPSMAMTGLDGPSLELYPKTLLGESRRLPKPNDNMCPICLSEYQPKETLRTIPECNHYFHADCVDEWLKMNATCPLCRNSPDISSIATPFSSLFGSCTVASPSSSSSSYSGR